MGLLVILGALMAMNIAAFLATRLLTHDWPAAFAAGRLATIAFIVTIGVWFGMTSDTANPPAEMQIRLTLLAAAALAMTALVRWRLPAAGWARSLLIGLATAAAMAGGYLGGVALSS
ncbi:MAG: hypothetical protein QM698_14785 [Micropepsaceae bacterium]